MPTLTIADASGDFNEDFNADKRLVLAIEAMGFNLGHRCGGKAACTTCRVEFVSGEPETMTKAEYNKLKSADLFGQVRLSCQLRCSQDMTLKPLMLLEDQPWADTGPAPTPEIQPEATWYPLSELEAE